jgi:hypothetical protein
MGESANANTSYAFSGGTGGTMKVEPLTGAKTMSDAVQMAKTYKDNSTYNNQITFKTDSKTD